MAAIEPDMPDGRRRRVDDDDDDDVIVLPWWQHPLNILTIVITAALLAGMVGWMIGDTNAELAHNEVDTGFLQDMREHHEQAVYMSFIYDSLPDIDPGLRTVATSIIIGQNQDIGRMVQMLRMFGETEANEGETSMAWMGMPVERGQMPGMASEEDLDKLATLSGREADEFFVQLMKAHHEGGDPHGRVRVRQRQERRGARDGGVDHDEPAGRDRRDAARARQLIVSQGFHS